MQSFPQLSRNWMWQAPPVKLTVSNTGTRCNFKHTETLTQFPDAHVAGGQTSGRTGGRTDRRTDGWMGRGCPAEDETAALQTTVVAEKLLTVCMCRGMKPRWEAVTFLCELRSWWEKIKCRWEFIWCTHTQVHTFKKKSHDNWTWYENKRETVRERRCFVVWTAGNKLMWMKYKTPDTPW